MTRHEVSADVLRGVAAAGQRSYRSVAGGAERLRHALLRPCQDVAAGSHSSSNQHRLPCELQTAASQNSAQPSNGGGVMPTHLVVDGDERVVWGEGPGGALPMDQQSLLLAVDHMLLHLGDVVRHVVDDVHVQVIGCCAEHLGKGLRDGDSVRNSLTPDGS